MVERVTAELYEHVYKSVFVCALEGDLELIQRIDSFAGNVSFERNCLRFDLPSLFEFACRDHEREHGVRCDVDRPAYLRFRKYLYEQPTNARLRERGAEITVASAHESHDRRLYELVHTPRLKP